MKDIQVIDAALNAVYDIFQATDEEFALIFPAGTDIPFSEEVALRKSKDLDAAFGNMWTRRIPKKDVQGIHGVLFYGLAHKRCYYPTLKDEEAVNPDGSRLR